MYVNVDIKFRSIVHVHVPVILNLVGRPKFPRAQQKKFEILDAKFSTKFSTGTKEVARVAVFRVLMCTHYIQVLV